MGDLVPIRPVVEPGGSEPRAVEPLWREAVGQLLRDRRHDRGEKLSETAGRAGVSTQYLSEVERGRKEPSSEVISAVAGALDLTLRDLTVGVARRLSAPDPTTAGHRGGTTLALAA